MGRRIKIGTRGSKLALWQAHWVKSAIQKNHPSFSIEIVTLKTKGDKILDVPLAMVGGKGLFVKEIEEATLERVAFDMPPNFEILGLTFTYYHYAVTSTPACESSQLKIWML